MGVPGWPDWDASTASIASARMALMLRQASASAGDASAEDVSAADAPTVDALAADASAPGAAAGSSARAPRVRVLSAVRTAPFARGTGAGDERRLDVDERRLNVAEDNRPVKTRAAGRSFGPRRCPVASLRQPVA